MLKFVTILGVAFCIVNLSLWYAVPAIRDAVDAADGRLDAMGRPTIIYGAQELLVYYDPWLARFIFPLVFTVGFATVPVFVKSVRTDASPPPTSATGAVIVSLALIGLEAV
jgi:hypothetical protein